MKTSTATWHFGRSWVGHPLEDNCPCPKEACGLVGHSVDTCEQHNLAFAKTIRQSHRAEDCPAR